MESKAPSLTVVCEVCGAYFETRRGLSSHARLHLRQLGVTLSETSGAPIDLLYQIVQERDGPFPSSSTPLIAPVPSSNKNTQEGPGIPKGPTSKSKGSFKHGNKVRTTGLSVSPSVRKGSGPSLSAANSRLSGASTSTTSGTLATAKPLWAPQASDAPLTLAMNSNDEVHVCQLCGAWYETRKGLASHARAHLRQFGVTENTETKGGPIEFLYQLMDAEDLKPIGSRQEEPMNLYTPSKPSLKRQLSLSPSPNLTRGSPSPLQSPSSKQAKPSDEFVCILCGEEFGNRKGLASHSRSHLRGFGITDLMGKASAIDTVHQLVDSGVLAAVRPTDDTTKAVFPDPAPPLSPSPSISASKAPNPAPGPAKSTQSPLIPLTKAPKAKKGFRLAVDPLNRKPKPEPEESEVSSPLGDSSPSTQWPSPDGITKSLSAVPSPEIESIPLIPCDFCGQFFDSRKALSCHARAHLRQLGITWSLNESPIETLQDVMLQGGEIKKEPSSVGAKSAWSQPTWAPRVPKKTLENSLETASPATFTPPLDFSLKGKPSQGKSEPVSATCCELCGFDFENRKALSSHARAHLRQLGVTEWRVKVSPIELLREMIQKEPEKVAEITRRYRMGDLHIKKRSGPSPSPSTYSAFVPSGSRVPPGLHLGRRAGREVAGAAAGHSSRAPAARSQTERGNTSQHTLSHNQAAHGDLILRSPRGFERRLSKHPVPREGGAGETDSQMPSRSGNIPAMLPKPPLTPLVKLVGKIYSLKCRFCEEVFCGPLSIQEDWIRHLQKHIVTLGYSKTSPPSTPVSTPVLIGPLAV